MNGTTASANLELIDKAKIGREILTQDSLKC